MSPTAIKPGVQYNKLGYNPAFAQPGGADQLTGRLKAGYLGLSCCCFFFLIVCLFLIFSNFYRMVQWFYLLIYLLGFSASSSGKESTCQCRRCRFYPWVRKIDPLEEEMATHSSILAWRISWTEEPEGLQFLWGSAESDTTEHATNYKKLEKEICYFLAVPRSMQDHSSLTRD